MGKVHYAVNIWREGVAQVACGSSWRERYTYTSDDTSVTCKRCKLYLRAKPKRRRAKR